MMKNLQHRKELHPSHGEEAPLYPYVEFHSLPIADDDAICTDTISVENPRLDRMISRFYKYIGRNMERAQAALQFNSPRRIFPGPNRDNADNTQSTLIDRPESTGLVYESILGEIDESLVERESREVETFLDKQAGQLPQSKPSAASHIEHWISHYRDKFSRTRLALNAGAAGTAHCDILRYFYKHRHAFQFAKEITTKKAFNKLNFLLKEKAGDEISLELLDICADHLLEEMENGSTDAQHAALEYMTSLLDSFPDAHSLFLDKNLREILSPLLSDSDNGVEPEVKLLAEKVYKLILTERKGQESEPSGLDEEIAQGQKSCQSEDGENQEVGDGESLELGDSESTKTGNSESTKVGEREITKMGDDEGIKFEDGESTKVLEEESGRSNTGNYMLG